MKPTVLITGANGMLAKSLAELLVPEYSVRFLTRTVSTPNEYKWDIQKKYIDPEALIGVDHIIHLAGSSIADKRWSKSRKEDLRSSRIDSGLLILNQLKEKNLKIDSYITASAVGYYGTKTTDKTFTEESPSGNDYLSSVCVEWEKVAELFKKEQVADRTAVVRIGVVLSKNNKIVNRIVQPISFGIGAVVGSGNQYMPWIHLDDLAPIFKMVLISDRNELTINAVAPEHINNNIITHKVAALINRKILLPKIPKFIIKLMFGEMSIIILEGSRVSSKKIIDMGYKFKYDTLDKALHQILK